MILHLIERYNTVYWLIFLTAAAFKVLLSIPIEGSPNGIFDIFMFLLKWYSSIDFSLIDSSALKARMRLQNLITLVMIFFLLIIGGVMLLKMLI